MTSGWSPWLALLVLVSLGWLSVGDACPEKPNIIFVLLDDAGWADFQSVDPLMYTPTIKKLREEGLFLNQSYVLPMCAPTRAALMTGRYPHTFGAQNGKSGGTNKKHWVPLEYNLLPKEMKRLGYKTHMLGKWHMGYCHPELHPMRRGFDSFYGFLLGQHSSYYTHIKGRRGPYDWWEDETVDYTANMTYNTELINDRAVKLIKEAKKFKPFFMFLAYATPHGPMEVPQSYIDKYCPADKVTDEARRIHCAMVAALDVGMEKIVDALKERKMYDDTVIVLMSDNGGAISHSSSNHPFRGGKKTIYEGGTRTYTVIRSSCLSVTGTTYPGMIHAVDWVPTLVGMGGGNTKPYMHGMNIWDSIKNFEDSPRTEFLYTRDDYVKFNHSAYRYKQWKLIQGNPGFDQGWYPPYNLVSEEHPYKDVKKDYTSTDIEFYNIETDPEEKHNLAKDKTVRAELKETKRRMKKFMKKYPLQPFHAPESSDDWIIDLQDHKILNTCWCQPSGVKGPEVCPKPE